MYKLYGPSNFRHLVLYIKLVFANGKFTQICTERTNRVWTARPTQEPQFRYFGAQSFSFGHRPYEKELLNYDEKAEDMYTWQIGFLISEIKFCPCWNRISRLKCPTKHTAKRMYWLNNSFQDDQELELKFKALSHCIPILPKFSRKTNDDFRNLLSCKQSNMDAEFAGIANWVGFHDIPEITWEMRAH